MAYVRASGNRIRFRFRIGGEEVSSHVETPPTKANLRAASSIARSAEHRLRAGAPWPVVRAELRGEPASVDTVGHYAQHFLDHKQVERSTLIQYQNSYNAVWSGLDALPVSSVRKSEIERMLFETGYTPKGMRNALSLFRQVLQVAVDDGVIQDNPCKGITLKRHQKPAKTPYTRAESQALLSHLSGRHHAFFALAFATGMRTGELLALQPRHLCEPYIRVEQVMSANQLEARTKTFRPRNVYVPVETWPLLKPFRFQDWVFQYKGKPYHQANRIMEHFNKAHILAGIERRPGPYPWRMSYISWLLSDGVRPDLVCQQTGHDLKTMLDHYAQFIPKDDDAPSIERALRGLKRGLKKRGGKSDVPKNH